MLWKNVRVVSLYTYFRGLCFFPGSGEGEEGWKKGIMGWGHKVLHGILSKIHQYHVTTEPIAMMANNKANH